MGQKQSELCDHFGVEQMDMDTIDKYWDNLEENHGIIGQHIMVTWLTTFPEDKNYFALDPTIEELDKDPCVIVHGIELIRQLSELVNNVTKYEMLVQIINILALKHKKLNIEPQAYVNLRASILMEISKKFSFPFSTMVTFRRALSALFQMMYNFNMDKTNGTLALKRYDTGEFVILEMSQTKLKPIGDYHKKQKFSDEQKIENKRTEAQKVAHQLESRNLYEKINEEKFAKKTVPPKKPDEAGNFTAYPAVKIMENENVATRWNQALALNDLLRIPTEGQKLATEAKIREYWRKKSKVSTTSSIKSDFEDVRRRRKPKKEPAEPAEPAPATSAAEDKPKDEEEEEEKE